MPRKKKSSRKKTSKKQSDTIEILLPENLTAYLTPVSIIIGSVIISLALIFSLKNLPTASVLGERADSGDNIAEQPEQPKVPNYEKAYDYAKEIGLNRKKLVNCVENEDFSEERNKDLDDGALIGITGTPGFVVGKLNEDGIVKGTRIPGAYPYETFSKVIEKYLNDGSFQENDPDLEGLEHGVEVSIDDDPKKGSDQAKVAVVEFSDYECPFCKRHATGTGKKIEENYIETDKVIWVFRDLPLSFHEPVASKEAQIAECARVQGGDDAYFKMHDFIFENTAGNAQGIQ
ncbi:thioredoxin domain-containing protein [Candidatus Dojkabacteria bacterium]|nr:thioredoxin domain-containing protein [Candidatus Dojkabacteria bacterium]